MENAGQEVMLFYIVCDESASMATNGGIETINQSLPELHATLVSDPLVVDKSRLSIIAFSDTAEVILPMSKATDIQDMPGVAENASTSYGAAFNTLRQAIEADVNGLKSQGYRVFRPCVFFITDGDPTDDNWESAYDSLMSHQYRPHIIAYGVDGATVDTLKRIGNLKAFMGVDRVMAAKALSSMMTSIGNTVVNSVSQVGPSGGGTIVVPPPPTGVVDLDEL